MTRTMSGMLHADYRPIKDCKKDFPLLQTSTLGSALHYLDNAATTQKPASVIDAISDSYRHVYGPIHRGLYPLAESATAAYEGARKTLSLFVGAANPNELIFTRSATEAINMVAWGWARPRLKRGDRLWITRMEHHSNFLPWQRICREHEAELRIIELNEEGCLDLDGAKELFDQRTRLIALCHRSNVLGIENSIGFICKQAMAAGIPVLVDAAQSVGHKPINVKNLGCDFLVFSAHKMYGPSGIGALYGKTQRLEEMEPLLLGGGMVDQVDDGQTTLAAIPDRFESGSPNLANAVGFAAAADYLSEIGMEAIEFHVSGLTKTALRELSTLQGIRLYPHQDIVRSSIISFNLENIHPHDVAQVAAEHRVAIRAGHHCCQPLMHALGITGTARASFGIYNQQDDIDALLQAVDKVRQVFR